MPWVWRSTWPFAPRLLFAIVLTAMLTFSMSCNRSIPSPENASSITPATPSPTPINPRALLEDSGKIMSNLESFRFVIEHEEGGTPLADGLTLIKAEGSIIKPDKISVEFSASAGGFAIKSSLISIGNTSFMTNPLNGEWGEVSQEVSPLAFFNPQNGISSIMSQVQNPHLASTNSRTHTVTGTLPTEALLPLFGITVEGESVTIEVVLDAEELYMTRATLNGKITPTEIDGLVRVIRLSRFDVLENIEAPITQ